MSILAGSSTLLNRPILPSNQTPLGALPARFRRARVLVVGCGDVGQRAARRLPPRVGVLALVRDAAAAPALRAQGIAPLRGDLDDTASLRRLAGIATHVIHLAPPPGEGEGDARTQALLRALARRSVPAALVYGSTSGVYGDCGGAWIDETRALNPQTARARRRVAAEGHVRAFGRAAGVRASILRIPGIYAADRPNGTPRERLLRGTPVLAAADDVHAWVLARVLGPPVRLDVNRFEACGLEVPADQRGTVGVGRARRVHRGDADQGTGEGDGFVDDRLGRGEHAIDGRGDGHVARSRNDAVDWRIRSAMARGLSTTARSQ